MKRIGLVVLALGLAAVPSLRAATPTVAVDSVEAVLNAVPTPPSAFVGITPCRLADTRNNGVFPPGTFGPPSMVAQAGRVFPVAGQCGIPATAQAVSANLAVTNTSGTGFLSVWPGGDPQPSPLVASMNYSAGQTIANAVLAPLGDGGITVYPRVGLDLIIDVNGYFDAPAPPRAYARVLWATTSNEFPSSDGFDAARTSNFTAVTRFFGSGTYCLAAAAGISSLTRPATVSVDYTDTAAPPPKGLAVAMMIYPPAGLCSPGQFEVHTERINQTGTLDPVPSGTVSFTIVVP